MSGPTLAARATLLYYTAHELRQPPPPRGPYRQPGPDPAQADEHALNTLSKLYYIYGAFVAMAALITGAFAFLPALFFAAGATNRPGALPPPFAGGMFALIFGTVAALFMGKALIMLFAGHALSRRRRYVLCLVGAGTALVNTPLGTALGVYALVVLMRPEVKARFEQPLAPSGANALCSPSRAKSRRLSPRPQHPARARATAERRPAARKGAGPYAPCPGTIWCHPAATEAGGKTHEATKNRGC